MPGKKPKERQRYMLRVNDTLVEVTRAVYLAWYQAGRKERYQVEKMQRHGVCSMEELQEKGYDCSFSVLSPEEIVIRMSEIQELEEAMRCLAKEEAELITLLFFEEFTVKETAQYFGCCPKTIRYPATRCIRFSSGVTVWCGLVPAAPASLVSTRKPGSSVTTMSRTGS